MSYLSAAQVMQLMHYTNRSSFWEMVKSQGLPYYRVTKRRYLFCEKTVRNWLETRNPTGGYGL